MKYTTLVFASLMLTMSGCQTCSNWTRSIAGQTSSCFSGLGSAATGGCRSCRAKNADNVGAPCDAGCESAPAPNAACSTCNQTANYGGFESSAGNYDGIVTGSYEGIPSGTSYSTVPSTTVPSGSYIGNPSGSSLRSGETIVPKPAR